MTTSQLAEAIQEQLQDLEVILSHLSNPNNLADSDGEHVRAILAKTGLQKLSTAQDLLDSLETT